MIVQGKDLMLFTSGVSIAMATNTTLDLSCETKDVSSKDHGDWLAYVAGKLGWNLKSDNLYTTASYDTLVALMIARTPIDIVFATKGNTGTDDGTGVVVPAGGWTPTASSGYSGKVIIAAISANAPDGDKATFSVTLQGTGALSPAAATVVAVKASQTYTAGSGFKQLIYTVGGVEKTSGGTWVVSTPKSGVGVTSSGEIFADTGTTGGTIGVKVTYLGVQSAAVNVTVS